MFWGLFSKLGDLVWSKELRDISIFIYFFLSCSEMFLSQLWLYSQKMEVYLYNRQISFYIQVLSVIRMIKILGTANTI